MSSNSSFRSLILALSLSLVLPSLFGCHRDALQSTVATPPIGLVNQNKAAAVPERVSLESLDHDPSTGTPVVIQALLFKPNGADSRRIPAVVAMHGCGGMYSTMASKRDALSARHQIMAELLVAEGYAVLFPDSFRSRGFEEICSLEFKNRSITQQNRRLDAQGALAWLQHREDIQPEHVAILGWSHGGSAVLATLNAKQPAVVKWRERRPEVPYFNAGAVFYPGCSESLKVSYGYSLAAPLTFFIGGSDDWTAPGPCVDLAAKLSSAGEDATITVYPDAYHGFDGPSTQPRRRLEVPNGVNPGKGVTVAANPAARDDAYAKLKQYLRTHLTKPYHHLVILGDPHLPGRYIESKREVIETINAWNDLDMVVAVGDICEDRGTKEEYASAKDFFDKLKKPLFPIVGNHDYIYSDILDIKGKRDRAVSKTREEKQLKFRQTFGLQDVSYVKAVGKYSLIFLSPDSPGHLTEISEKQMKWLHSELENNRKRPTIIFFHAPLEGTLRNYNGTVNGPNRIAQPSGRIRDLLMSNPQVFLWVSGHTHTSPKEESFSSEINLYEKRITTIHNSDMNRETIWTNSLFLYPDKIVVKTYNHNKGMWLPEFERTVMPPTL
ncbi:MAG: dienelactone hydrolase family protein [Deltaproteobacteria bacterium]